MFPILFKRCSTPDSAGRSNAGPVVDALDTFIVAGDSSPTGSETVSEGFFHKAQEFIA